MKLFYYRLSFQHRVWIGIMLVVSVAVAATGIFSYRIAAGMVERNAYQLSQDALNKTSQALDEKFSKIRTSVFSMMLNSSYQKAVGLEQSISSSENYYTYLSSLQSVFVQLKLIEPMLASILLATPEGDYYQTTIKRQHEQSFYESDIYARIKESNENHVEIWVEGRADPYFSDHQRVISFVTEGTLNDISKDIFVVANIKEEALQEFISYNLKSSDDRYILVSQDGNDVFQNDTPFFAEFQENSSFLEALRKDEGFFEYQFEGYNYLINYKKVSSVDDWMLFSILPKADLFQELDNIKWAICLIIFCCLVVSFVFSRFITRFLLKPLQNLRKLMLKVGNNDLSVRFESDYNDEITQVGFRFNRMLEEITLLFQEVTNAEKEKSKLEVKVLQAQIDPHFLYNTLNTIYWKCQLKQMNNVQNMVLSLSRLFQLGLNKGHELTTLKNELTHVEQYLIIQQECYENLFTFTIDVQTDVDIQQPILKILLQPLVENSIMHGFKDLNEGGKIRIEIRKENNHLLLIVEDNGRGMDDMVSVQQSIEPMIDGQQLHGFALYNIYRRLHLHYGDEASLKVESQFGLFTRISLTIPKIVEHDSNL